MAITLLPQTIRDSYEVHEWRHACSILHSDFPNEWAEAVDVISRFRLQRTMIEAAGGGLSPISNWFNTEFLAYGWVETSFDTQIVVDNLPRVTPTHSVDCFKNRVALEIEWNNKDPFFDRDLNNFRLLFELDVISLGIIITRCDALQGIFNTLGKGKSYGASTTHMSKLLPKVNGGGAGGCPVLVFGISPTLYVDNVPANPNP